MKLEDLQEIHALVEAKYEVRRQLFQKLVKKENEIRADIDRIDRQAKVASQKQDTGMQSIGADVMWKAWLEKTRASLNMKLALILAEKDQHIHQVKQAYGKVIAAKELRQELSRERSKNAENKKLNEAIHSNLFR